MAQPDLSKNMRATAEAFIYGFNGDWAPSATLAQRAEECEHVLYPTSLGMPKRSKQEWADYFNSICHLVKDAKMVINDYVSCPDECRAVVFSSMTATTPVGPYSNEYVWFFTFDANGEKVVHINEFMDSKSAGNLFAQLKEAGLR